MLIPFYSKVHRRTVFLSNILIWMLITHMCNFIEVAIQNGILVKYVKMCRAYVICALDEFEKFFAAFHM